MKEINELLPLIQTHFNTFGGGRSSGNPVAEAFKDEPLMFAAGVDVRSVLEFVVAYVKERKR